MKLGKPEPWMEGAACAQVDADLWFPEIGSNANDAKAICRQCPVLEQCLAYAVEHQEEGIWGATSKKQRQRLRTQGVAA